MAEKKHFSKTIFIYLNYINRVGGVEASLVPLVDELQKLGIRVHLFTQLPVEADNLYVQELTELGCQPKYPRLGPIGIYDP